MSRFATSSCRTSASRTCCGAICSRSSPRCHIGAASVERLAAKLGEERFEAALRQLLDRSEAAMRAVIGRIPDGTYEFEDQIDDDGISDAPIRIHAKLIDRRRRDHGRPLRLQPAGDGAEQRDAVVHMLDGLLCADRVGRRAHRRQCRLLSPGQDHCAAGPVRECRRAGAGRAPHRHRAPAGDGAVRRAASGGAGAHAGRLLRRSYVVTFQTIDPELGRSVLVEIEVGGIGALPASDGASALSFGMHNNANIPMEMIESDMPLTFWATDCCPIQAAPAGSAAGLGLWREWRIDCPMAQLSTNLDRFKFRPFGLAGGGPAAPSALYLMRDGRTQALPSKVTNLMLRRATSFGSKLPAAAASAKPGCGRGSLSSATSGSAM